MAAPVDPHLGRPSVLDVAVFGIELWLLAMFALAGVDLGGGVPTEVALGVALPLVAAVLWGWALSPRARRPLGYPGNLIAKLALVVVAAVLAGISGTPLLAAIFGVVALGVITAAEVARRTRAPR